MSLQSRRKHSAAFKRGTVAELARQYEVHPSQIADCKRLPSRLSTLPDVFAYQGHRCQGGLQHKQTHYFVARTALYLVNGLGSCA